MGIKNVGQNIVLKEAGSMLVLISLPCTELDACGTFQQKYLVYSWVEGVKLELLD